MQIGPGNSREQGNSDASVLPPSVSVGCRCCFGAGLRRGRSRRSAARGAQAFSRGITTAAGVPSGPDLARPTAIL